MPLCTRSRTLGTPALLRVPVRTPNFSKTLLARLALLVPCTRRGSLKLALQASFGARYPRGAVNQRSYIREDSVPSFSLVVAFSPRLRWSKFALPAYFIPCLAVVWPSPVPSARRTGRVAALLAASLLESCSTFFNSRATSHDT